MGLRRDVNVSCSTPAPMAEDGSIDEPAIRTHFRRLIEARTGLYVAIGGASEAHVLTRAEMKRIAAIGVEEARGRVTIVAGQRECRSADEVHAIASDAVAAGVDAVYMYQLDNGHGMVPTEYEQAVYWHSLLSEITHPVIMCIHYEAKFRPPMKLLLEILKRYRQVFQLNVAGAPQAYFLELLDSLPGIRINCGLPEFVQYATLGAGGYTNPAGNIIPYVCRSLVDAWNEGDLEQVARANLAIQRFQHIVSQWAPSTARWVEMAMKVQGIGNGVLRHPYLLPPDEDQRRMSEQFAAMELDSEEAHSRAYVEARS